MADALVEKLIADLVEGARGTEGFKRGSRVTVERQPDRGREEKLAAVRDAVSSARDEGTTAAAKNFGLEKNAILGALLGLGGSLAGPALARAGVGALAGGAGGQMLKGLAGRAMPHITSGLGGKAFDIGAGMLGGALGSRVGGAGQGPGKERPMSPMMGGLGGYVGGRWLPQPRMPEGPWQG